jgi:leucyl aminopeptidase
MEITVERGTAADSRAELLVVATGRAWKSPDVRQLDRALRRRLLPELVRQGFNGTEDAVAIFQTHGVLRAHTILLLGLGDVSTPRTWYKLADTVVRRARELKARSVTIAAPSRQWSPDAVERLAEGLRLAAYTFTRFKPGPPRPHEVQSVGLLVHAPDARWRAALDRAERLAAAACYARDLVNLPAAIVTPTYLGTEAKRLARAQRLAVRVLDPPQLRRLGMGALLGVAQGSAQPPRFIELTYTPRQRARRRVALAGKGITFDSGGLSIKPADAMQTQKRDMAGAAAVLGVMSVIRDLAPAVEVRAYVPAAENMPSGTAIRPGDVLRAYNGKTIEVLNTDAEGRLVLADALAYAAAAKPDVLIDLATLTAAVRMALGTKYAAIMGTNGDLVRQLIAAAAACDEHLWELPLVAEYRSDIDSSIADVKNTGEGTAGTIVGGLFLREFAGTVPWAHIDFSSTVLTDKPFACHPRGATGFGTRTLLRYLLAV